MAIDYWESITTLIFATSAIASTFCWLPKVKQTTLVSVLVWTTTSLGAIVAVELFALASGRANSNGLVESLRFAAATSTLCPFVARLGAKRPQQGAWHFVVATLWLVLASPSLESLILQPGQPLAVVGARSWFLAVLILVGLLDRVLTRFAGTALLAACGQSLLLAGCLPLPETVAQHFQLPWLGIALFAVSVALESCGIPRRRTEVAELDALWLDFRDNFGTLWGLRVLERMNAASVMYNWEIKLTWAGFQHKGPIETRDWSETFSTTLHNLLRRFVGPDWIAKRIGKRIDC